MTTETTKPSQRPDLAARMCDLQTSLDRAIKDAEAAHSEVRLMHTEYVCAKPPMRAAGEAAWQSMNYLGAVLGELRTIRGRL